MNAYMYLVLAVLSSALLIYSFVPEVILLVGGLAVGIFFAVYILTMQLIYPRMYPYRIRCYASRYDSLAVTVDSRAKISTDKKGLKYFELPGGRRLKYQDKKYMMKGKSGDIYIDIYDTVEQQFPINIDLSNMEEIRKNIISENQRVWYTKRVTPTIKEITKAPTSAILQIAMIAVPIVIVLMIAVVLLFYPTYFSEMDKIFAAKQGKLDSDAAALAKMYERGIITCDCGGGKFSQINTPPIVNITGG